MQYFSVCPFGSPYKTIVLIKSIALTKLDFPDALAPKIAANLSNFILPLSYKCVYLFLTFPANIENSSDMPLSLSEKDKKFLTLNLISIYCLLNHTYYIVRFFLFNSHFIFLFCVYIYFSCDFFTLISFSFIIISSTLQFFNIIFPKIMHFFKTFFVKNIHFFKICTVP